MNTRLKVVVADDNEMMREFLRRALAHLGHDTVVVAGGGELIGTCRTQTPDVVLSDVNMPDLDGITAASVIRRWSAVPIVLMSGAWDDELIQRATAAGATRCLQKPIRPLELVEILDAVRSPPPSAECLLHWFVESVPDYAVVTLDAGGRVATWNRGAECLYGVPAGLAIGRVLSELVCECPAETLRRAERDGRATRSACGRRDGKRVPTAEVVVALRGPSGDLAGYGVIVRAATSEVAPEAAPAASSNGVYSAGAVPGRTGS